MFHFWFNTFFVNEMYEPPGMAQNGAGHTHSQQTELICLTVPKMDLDRANKDKSHKLFSPNFKVFCIPCLLPC